MNIKIEQNELMQWSLTYNGDVILSNVGEDEAQYTAEIIRQRDEMYQILTEIPTLQLIRLGISDKVVGMVRMINGYE